MEKTKENVSTVETTKKSRPRPRVIENYLIVWLDAHLDETIDDENENLETKLKTLVNTVETFSNVEKCADFLLKVVNEEIFLIVSGSLGEKFVPLIHDLERLKSIYVFCAKKSKHEVWSRNYPKIRSVSDSIELVESSIVEAISESERNNVPLSFVTTEQLEEKNFDQIDPNLILSKILQEILLDIRFDDSSIVDFVEFCSYQTNEIIEKDEFLGNFKHNYRTKTPIWWYTYPTFLHSMLNRALRTNEIETIVKMAFFINDLHRQIELLHKEQIEQRSDKNFVVYRGQSMSKIDFEKLLQTKAGFLSFNNFLSTSFQRNVSRKFAEDALKNLDAVGVLFKIEVDRRNSATPFAFIDDFSYFASTEKEVLFSMNTIFRISSIKPIENQTRLFQVDLKLTTCKNQQVNAFLDRIRRETSASTGWHRLANVLVKFSHFKQAEQIYETILLEKRSSIDDEEIGFIYHQLGLIYRNVNQFGKALEFYRKSVEIYSKIEPRCDEKLGKIENNIGQVFIDLCEFEKARESLEKAWRMLENSVERSICAENMAMLERKRANFEASRNILESISPHDEMNSSFLEKTFASLFFDLGQLEKSLEARENSLRFEEKFFSSEDRLIVVSKTNLAAIFVAQRKFAEAVKIYENSLKSLPKKSLDAAKILNNVAEIFRRKDQPEKSIFFLKKTLEIEERILPENHLDLATTHNNLGLAFNQIELFDKAIFHHEKALQIRRSHFEEKHPIVAASLNNLGAVFHSRGDFQRARQLYEQALQIELSFFDHNHLDLATTFLNLATIFEHFREFQRAKDFYQRTEQIFFKHFAENHPQMIEIQRKIEFLQAQLSPNFNIHNEFSPTEIDEHFHSEYFDRIYRGLDEPETKKKSIQNSLKSIHVAKIPKSFRNKHFRNKIRKKFS